MEAIEMSIPQMDSAAMADLAPKLANIIRKGVGLPTKAGSARFVVSLCLAVPNEFKAP
jgi:proteasome component ECM29